MLKIVLGYLPHQIQSPWLSEEYIHRAKIQSPLVETVMSSMKVSEYSIAQRVVYVICQYKLACARAHTHTFQMHFFEDIYELNLE